MLLMNFASKYGGFLNQFNVKCPQPSKGWDLDSATPERSSIENY